MKVPNGDKAIVAKAKITDYLLNPAHRVGGPKSAFFLAFGFTASDWQVMATALVLDVRTYEVARSGRTVNAATYRVVGPLFTPDGRNPVVLSAWYIRDGDTIPRFSTAYPR